ncbi:hypothetical protein COO60DRAFT_1623684 [Scenedesmus sp. NREL 46B-D3]|nr:hypothetical protein COO60DRAFT_1623684 [Scenedesmus sp. NREL 46B-D3]
MANSGKPPGTKRLFVISSVVAYVLFAGVPIWWATTSLHRPPLPHEQIAEVFLAARNQSALLPVVLQVVLVVPAAGVLESRVLHFLVYVPAADKSPLLLLGPYGSLRDSNSFWIPSWGGVLVLNLVNETAAAWGGAAAEEAGEQGEGADVMEAARVLGSLSRLVQQLPNLEMPDLIGQQLQLCHSRDWQDITVFQPCATILIAAALRAAVARGSLQQLRQLLDGMPTPVMLSALANASSLTSLELRVDSTNIASYSCADVRLATSKMTNALSGLSQLQRLQLDWTGCPSLGKRNPLPTLQLRGVLAQAVQGVHLAGGTAATGLWDQPATADAEPQRSRSRSPGGAPHPNKQEPQHGKVLAASPAAGGPGGLRSSPSGSQPVLNLQNLQFLTFEDAAALAAEELLRLTALCCLTQLQLGYRTSRLSARLRRYDLEEHLPAVLTQHAVRVWRVLPLQHLLVDLSLDSLRITLPGVVLQHVGQLSGLTFLAAAPQCMQAVLLISAVHCGS